MAARIRSRARKAMILFRRDVARKHWDAVLAQDRAMKTWCRSNKVLMGQLIRSVIKFFPEEWEKHKDSLGEIMVGKCAVCTLPFYANTKKQKFCSDQCGEQVWPSRRARPNHHAQVTSPDGKKDPSR